MNEIALHVQGRVVERLVMLKVVQAHYSDSAYRQGWMDALKWFAELIHAELPQEPKMGDDYKEKEK